MALVMLFRSSLLVASLVIAKDLNIKKCREEPEKIEHFLPHAKALQTDMSSEGNTLCSVLRKGRVCILNST
jgi:hypothetical protein